MLYAMIYGMSENDLALFFIIIAAFLLFFSCATSRGNLFKQTSEADKPKTTFTEDDDERYNVEEEEEENKLTITSRPEGAEIYIDSVYYGKTPLTIEHFGPGDYRLELRLTGYYTHTDWIYYSGENMTYETELDPVTGYLEITVTPSDAIIIVGGEYITGPREKIPVGIYSLRIRSFGYTDVVREITIEENKTTQMEVTLEEAMFSVSGLSVSRKSFNPANPGSLGKTIISFYVTTYGKATARIFDKGKNEVFSHSFPSFSTWPQECEWDGKDKQGLHLPDGEYTIEIHAEGRDGEVEELSANVLIDSSITLSFRSLWNGVSGLFYTPTVETLPAWSLQISPCIMAHCEEGEKEILLRAPFNLSARFGIGSSLEIDLLAALIFSNEEFSPLIASISIKKLLFHSRGLLSFSGAAYAKACYHYGTGADTFSNFTGISAGIPLQGGLGPLSVILTPEIVLSTYRVTYTSDYDEEIAFFTWGYCRGGILLDFGTVITGISCAVRTLPFSEGFGISLPALGALECHLMVPDTSIYVTLAAATEFSSIDNFYVMGGFGLGFIY
jgi:hypothetical protein